MRWVPFVILALVTIVCQTTLGQTVAIGGVWPDWMFVLAVYYALWGPWPDAAIAAWLLGLLVGLQTADRIGLHAFTYGAAAWGIVRVRQVLFRDHPATQLGVTFVFALAVQVVVALVRGWGAPAERGMFLGYALLTALYTAAWAPFVHWPLLRLGRWTGLQRRRDFAPAR